MVSENMLSNPSSRGFLIDGFPRELKQAKEFERIVSVPGDMSLSLSSTSGRVQLCGGQRG
jgi:adenylate kinase family enzyme